MVWLGTERENQLGMEIVAARMKIVDCRSLSDEKN